MATLPNSTNADLSRGFTVAQVAQKHDWTDPMVWSLALEGKIYLHSLITVRTEKLSILNDIEM
jgi:hypothetical protein